MLLNSFHEASITLIPKPEKKNWKRKTAEYLSCYLEAKKCNDILQIESSDV